jgi:hypothetical protein
MHDVWQSSLPRLPQALAAPGLLFTLIKPIMRAAAELLRFMQRGAAIRIRIHRCERRSTVLSMLWWAAALLVAAGTLYLAIPPAAFESAVALSCGSGWWRSCAAVWALAALATLVFRSAAGIVHSANAAIAAALGMRGRQPAIPPPPSHATMAAGGTLALATETIAHAGTAPTTPHPAQLTGAMAPAGSPRRPLVSTALVSAPHATMPARFSHVGASTARSPSGGIDLGVLQQLLCEHQRGATAQGTCSGVASLPQIVREAAGRESLYHSPLRHVFIGAKVRGGLAGSVL